MIFWVTYGLEIVLVHHLLGFFAPLTLYLLRCLIIFITITLVSKPNFKIIQPTHLPVTFVLGALAIASMTALYTAFQRIGVAASLLVLVLSPTFVYWFSGAVLHDRWNKKSLIAGALIVVLVIAVSWWRAV